MGCNAAWASCPKDQSRGELDLRAGSFACAGLTPLENLRVDRRARGRFVVESRIFSGPRAPTHVHRSRRAERAADLRRAQRARMFDRRLRAPARKYLAPREPLGRHA